MEIPDDLLFEICYKQGSVFYFVDEELSSQEPHFFIVLNHSPSSQQVFILAVSSHQVLKTYYRRPNEQIETLIEITPSDYEGFTKDSIIDCNRVFQKSIADIKEKHKSGKLKSKPTFPEELLKKVINGVKKSKLIEKNIKDLL